MPLRCSPPAPSTALIWLVAHAVSRATSAGQRAPSREMPPGFTVASWRYEKLPFGPFEVNAVYGVGGENRRVLCQDLCDMIIEASLPRIDLLNPKMMTPLMAACSVSNVDLVHRLLEGNADPNVYVESTGPDGEKLKRTAKDFSAGCKSRILINVLSRYGGVGHCSRGQWGGYIKAEPWDIKAEPWEASGWSWWTSSEHACDTSWQASASYSSSAWQ